MYLPKSRYTEAKSTNGSEFVEKGTTTYYKGMYFETYTKQFFAGTSPTDNGVELEKISNHGDQAAMLLAGGMGIIGTAVAGHFIKTPTQSEKDKGVLKRYFVQDRNTNKIVETDKVNYLQTQKNVPNRNLAQVDWIIEGPAENQMFGKYPFEGAESKNKKTVEALESQMKGISAFITDYKYLVEDPVVNQKPTITTQTFAEKDASTQLENSRKANFDLKK